MIPLYILIPNNQHAQYQKGAHFFEQCLEYAHNCTYIYYIHTMWNKNSVTSRLF